MIDLHCDTIFSLWKEESAYTLADNPFSISSGRLRDGGVRGQCFALFTPMHSGVPALHSGKSPWQIVNELHDVFVRETADAGIPMMDSVSGLSDGNVHAILTTEEGGAIEGDISRLAILREWGVRIFGLTWNWENELGYPNSRDPEIMEKGLKEKGIEAVEECGRLGIIVDVSHLSDGGFMDVARYSKLPFVATHSNCRSVTAASRNLTDEELRILADHGGVAGLNLCPAFLSEDDPSTEAEAESRISDMVRHVMHAYRTAGEDVLAIGTDFDGIGGRLEIPSPDRMHLLRDALAAAGMRQSVLDKMWDGNAERVLLAAEEVFR